MRETNCGASELRVTRREDNDFTLSPTTMGGHANDTVLDGGGSTSNPWVEATLHESGEDEVNLGIMRLSIARREVSYYGRNARFSPLDFALLLLLARHKNKMLSYARIYRRLWGPKCKISTSRLRVHVCRIRQKLAEECMDGIRIINRGGLGYVIEIDTHLRGLSVLPINLDSGSEPATSSQPSSAGTFRKRHPRVATAAE
jgi:DNA-binding response OmpR family regulator